MIESIDIDFESEIYRMPHGAFMMRMLYLYCSQWLWGGAVVIALSLIPGIAFDIRWLIVSCMLIFIIAPMLFAFLYIYFGFRRENVANVVLHKVHFSDEGILVTVYQPIFDSEKQESEEDGSFGREISFEYIIPYSDINGINIENNSVTLPSRKTFLWMPADCFGNTERFNNALEYIANKISREKDEDTKG